MDSGRCKMRTNTDVDRLSSLPNELIHKILSFMSIKDAIKTSRLSSRWRFIWTSLPYLDFSRNEFRTSFKFSNFVTNFLLRHNNQVQVFSVNLSSCEIASQKYVKKILDYAFSHNVQQMNVKCLVKNKSGIPLSLFSSPTLKHLTLTGFKYSHSVITTTTWELPALTTLHLNLIALSDKCVDLFSKCVSLQNLTLVNCRLMSLDVLNICNPQLSNLTLVNCPHVKVVAPQLKNLTIINCYEEILITARNLTSLLFKGCGPLHIDTDGFPSLEKVDLCISFPSNLDAHKIFRLLRLFHRVKFLTLNLEIVELLSSSVKLISQKPSPFRNLLSLKVYPEITWKRAQKNLTMSDKVKNFLLDSSPRATFTMVTYEDIKADTYARVARRLMVQLRTLLEEEKGTINITESLEPTMQVQQELGETQVANRKEHHIWRKMTQINSCWEDLSVNIDYGKEKTSCIVSKLQDIEELLREVPASKMGNMQERFSSLCAEADIVVNMIINRIKIQSDTKLSGFSGHFHELASASQSSSLSKSFPLTMQ